ncbi:hypothetical protein AAOE16_03030 [Ekhidna sp. MALMAid0563]|uniref:hypothetical protein n=1 Tax=Ekhidna sp. MALMAid0563 TaxID=3143937 RepID=UPI0032DEBAEE
MLKTNVRLKRQPDKKNGEDQVVIKVQYKQKQYPIPIPYLKVLPKHFDENYYGEWLRDSYTNKEGLHRKKTTVNNNIKHFKTKVDVALENLAEVGFEKLTVNLIKGAIGKDAQDLKENIAFIQDSFYNESLLEVYEYQFLPDYSAQGDQKNLKTLLGHLTAFCKQSKEYEFAQMKDLNSKFLMDFTWYLLDYQIPNRNKKDPHSYLTHETVFKQIKKLRKFIKFCEAKLHKEMPEIEYKFPFKGTIDVVNPLSLNPTELDILYHIDLEDKNLDVVRKAFLLAFATGGQRIGDVRYIIESKKYLSGLSEYFQKKTGRQMVSGILDGYFNKFSKDEITLPSDQHINRLLKKLILHQVDLITNNKKLKDKLGEISPYEFPFDREIKKKSFRGRSQKPVFTKGIPLHKELKFRHARHTFISTMIFREKKTKEDVMLYTGHASEQIINYYLERKKSIEAYEKDSKQVHPNPDLAYVINPNQKSELLELFEEFGTGSVKESDLPW